MNKRFFAFAGIVVIAGGVSFVYRTEIRDAWEAWRKPTLPTAARYQPPSSSVTDLAGEQNSPVEGGTATSQNYILVSSPTNAASKIDPFADNGPLPAEANLDVPFTSQAPLSDWNLPYQEACEEASVIMVDAFYRGVSGVIPPEDAKRAIDAVVEYQNKTLGFYKDTDAAQTASFMKGYFGYTDIRTVPLTSAAQMKRAIANGYPVLFPASGKLLNNPNFRNGGPPYHFLVVRGYSGNMFITNDPGTRKGEEYLYTEETLMNAAHDWNGGDVLNGKPLIMIAIPLSS